MTELLLITDVARLRKVFSRLNDDKSIRLRVVNNLEKGGEEIALEKPACVFVQTHLSGLSADIIHMHLKKRLGRKRTRFVLIAAPDQVNEAVLKPFQGWLDTSLDDAALLASLRLLIKAAPAKKAATATEEEATAPSPAPPAVSAEPPAATVTAPEPPPAASASPTKPVVDIAELLPAPSTGAAPEPSLEEQGLTYSSRSRLKVYSEFNSSFDSAVDAAPEPQPLAVEPELHTSAWAQEIETVEATPANGSRSKLSHFLVWLVPVVLAVVLVTWLQQRRPSAPATVTVAPAKKPAAPLPTPANSQPPAAPPPVAAAIPAPPAIPLPAEKAPAKAAAELPATAGKAAARPAGLPDFIPTYGKDKKYGAANPGWERYMGQVTEFKIFRDQVGIKAIQVIDRGGNGLPESFMKGVLRQMAKNPSFAVEATERKDGIEVQRGQAAAGLSVVYYRDEQGGRLRGFVMTWN